MVYISGMLSTIPCVTLFLNSNHSWLLATGTFLGSLSLDPVKVGTPVWFPFPSIPNLFGLLTLRPPIVVVTCNSSVSASADCEELLDGFVAS